MRTMTTTTCDFCGKKYKKDSFDFTRTKHNFCSSQCNGLSQRKRIQTTCGFCGKSITITQSYSKKSKSGKSFCDKSCAAIYNNKIKKKTRRSKVEISFHNLLIKKFPQLDILANDKTMLNGLEVDIAIPSLKLAIEWNGIVHFKPIYGEKKLNRVKEIDKEKLKIASNNNINLIVITDLVSNNQMLKKAFLYVENIIKNLLPEGTGNDPARPFSRAPSLAN